MKQKLAEFKEEIGYWKEFLLSNRYSIRFKICNIIMGGQLREGITFARINAKQIIEAEKLYKEVPEAQAKLAVIRAKHIWRDLDNIMR